MLTYIEYLGGFPTLNEVSQKTFNNIVDRLNIPPDEMSLNNMFKGKMRVAFPLATGDIQQLSSALIKNGFNPDYVNGTASKEVVEQQGPRAGQKKLQQFKIGRAIEVLVKQKAIDEKWWDYWNKNGGNLMKQAKENPNFVKSTEPEYSVIISRSPVDLLRMSDFEGISSCHSEGGSYFDCAIAEAKDGGAIAFTVKTEDLKGINLQDKEIFADPRRGVKGIVPKSRVRIRLYANKEDENIQLGIPERRVYGAQIPGFRDAVMDWSRENLKDTLNDERPRMDDFELVGGSYEDNSASDLFNDFFDDDEDSGDIDKRDSDNEDRNDMLRDEIEQINTDHNNFKNPINAYYDEHDDGDGVIFYWDASISFGFPASQWNQKPNWKEMQDLRKEFNRESNHGHIEDVEIESGSEDKFYVNCTIHDEDSNGHPDGYRDFLYYLSREYDDHYKEMHATMRGILIRNGILNGDNKDKLVKIVQNERFKNFNFDEDPYDGKTDYDSLSISCEPIELFSRKQMALALGVDHQYNHYQVQTPADALTDRTGSWASQQGKSYFPNKKPEDNFKLIQQVAMQKIRGWWGRVKQGYEQQPFLPGMQKPPFKDKMAKMVEPQLHFDWTREGSIAEQKMRLQIAFPFNWDMNTSQVVGTLRGIHFMDNNFDTIVDEIRKAVYDVITKEEMRVRQEEEQRIKDRKHPMAGNPNFNQATTFKTFVNPDQQTGQNQQDEQPS